MATLDATRDIIHFSHANGFPAGCYRKLLGDLARDFEVGFIETIGHDPRYPVTDCWPHLIEQLIDTLETRYDRPVIGVGHSLGGFLTFLTAVQRPDLFKAVILLDSPILGRLKSAGLALGKRFGFMERITPAGVCRTRRAEWASVEEAHDYFRAKPLFRHFDADCLRDYVEHGTVPTAQGVRLKFDPGIEYWIYCHLPHTYPRYRHQLKVPAAFMGGRHSHLVHALDIANMQRHHGIRCTRVDGSHLFPMEYPELTAATIRRLLAEMLAPAAGARAGSVG